MINRVFVLPLSPRLVSTISLITPSGGGYMSKIRLRNSEVSLLAPRDPKRGDLRKGGQIETMDTH